MKTVWEYIQEMLDYKKSLGFSGRSYEGFLNDFGRFTESKENFFFSETIVNEWCIQRDTEQESGFRRRITALREFSKYLYAMGISDYVVRTDILPSLHQYTPYIFTDEELIRFFQQSDKEMYDSKAPAKKLMIPVIYRLIYLCGLRPNEGRELMKSDIDFEKNTIFIRKNKSHRERLIPIADDVSDMCQQYFEKLCMIYPDSKYFFPSPTGQPYSSKWLTGHFLQIWNNSKEVKNNARVRVYDLRHRFATAVFMKWLDAGEDLYARLSYLSAYMGHTSLEDTAYYIHLLPEKLRKSSVINWNDFEQLFPEVAHE